MHVEQRWCKADDVDGERIMDTDNPITSLAKITQTAPLMEYLDPVHLSEILIDLGWTVDRHLAHLIDIVDNSDKQPRLKMQAMKQIDIIVERSALLMVKLATDNQNAPPADENDPCKINLGMDRLKAFQENTYDQEKKDQEESSPEEGGEKVAIGGYGGNMHIPPRTREVAALAEDKERSGAGGNGHKPGDGKKHHTLNV